VLFCGSDASDAGEAPRSTRPSIGGLREEAAGLGFSVGIVTNGYWATELVDALEWLRPFAGLVQDLSVSSDRLHWSEALSRQAEVTTCAAKELGIPLGIISIARPESANAPSAVGVLPPSESRITHRGRAAETLVDDSSKTLWTEFAECPFEDLRDPGRLHIDPLGNVHVCQGISMGSVFRQSLIEMIERYEADIVAGRHPIVSPLLSGGPARARQTPRPRSRGCVRRRMPPVLRGTPGAARPLPRHPHAGSDVRRRERLICAVRRPLCSRPARRKRPSGDLWYLDSRTSHILASKCRNQAKGESGSRERE
jgi:hypothetical protein